MDLADGTLVALREEPQTNVVFTPGHRGFSVYGLSRRKPFRLVP